MKKFKGSRHFRARRSLPALIVEGFPFSNFTFPDASYALLIASRPINKQRRPILIASFSALFAAARIFRASEMEGGNSRGISPQTASRKASGHRPDCRVARTASPGARITNRQSLITNHETPRPCVGFSHRVFLSSHRAPVDITVDKGSSTSSEKA